MDKFNKIIDKLKPHMDELVEGFEIELEQYQKLMSQSHDSLGRVLKCHLVVEHYPTKFLSEHFKIGHLDSANLSFAQKANLLPENGSSSAWVKPGILKLNSIRNKFGHNLNYQLTIKSLGPINKILETSQKEKFEDPILAIEKFTSVAAAFLTISPPNIKKIFDNAREGT